MKSAFTYHTIKSKPLTPSSWYDNFTLAYIIPELNDGQLKLVLGKTTSYISH